MCTEILGRSRVYILVLEKLALVPNAFKWGWGLPCAYLAVKLESRYTYMHIYYSLVLDGGLMSEAPGRGMWTQLPKTRVSLEALKQPGCCLGLRCCQAACLTSR